jgi:hypothetical protein
MNVLNLQARVQPALQRQDGNFIGTISTLLGTSMIAFTASGNTVYTGSVIYRLDGMTGIPSTWTYTSASGNSLTTPVVGNFMIAFTQSDGTLFTVPNDTPQIVTLGGGVIGTSGTTYDQNGNVTGLIANMPTQSWLGLRQEATIGFNHGAKVSAPCCRQGWRHQRRRASSLRLPQLPAFAGFLAGEAEV